MLLRHTSIFGWLVHAHCDRASRRICGYAERSRSVPTIGVAGKMTRRMGMRERVGHVCGRGRDGRIRRGPMGGWLADSAANGRRDLDIPIHDPSLELPASLSLSCACVLLLLAGSLTYLVHSLTHSHSRPGLLLPPLRWWSIGVASSSSSNGVERAEELQRRGRAQPAGPVLVPVRPLLRRLRHHHLRPHHHVRRVVPWPAPPRPPRRLVTRGLRVRPSGPRHRPGELRAVQGVGDLPLPVGDACRAGGPHPGGPGPGQLGEGAGVGGHPRRAGHVPGQRRAMGQPPHHPGHRVPGHRLRGAAAHHGEGPREEEVPGRRLRPAGLLQGPRQVRGAQAQGDQERPPRHARLRRLRRAAVGVPRHRTAREPGRPPRRPMAQQHRRHRHPKEHLRRQLSLLQF